MASMSTNVKIRLSLIFFLTFAMNGIWIIPLGTYLDAVGYSGIQIGNMYMTFALGFIFAPIFVGMIADRFFSAEKVLGVLFLVASLFMYAASKVAVSDTGELQPTLLFWMLLLHCLCYTPSWALTTTIALNQMDDRDKERQFPIIRSMGTIGWIAVSVISLFSSQVTRTFGAQGNFEETNLPLLIGSAIGVVAGICSFFMPSTPPKKTVEKPSIVDLLGLRALVLFKDKNYLIFGLVSFLIFFPGMFYMAFANVFLNEIGVNAPQFKMSIGQMSELLLLWVMAAMFAKLGVKRMMMLGLAAWLLRFVCLGLGDVGTKEWLLIVGIAVHGACFGFVFVTGQLYTERKASKEIQAQAQGLISNITFGLGWFVGSYIAGTFVDKYAYTQVVDGVEQAAHYWDKIWWWPVGMAVVVLVIFALFFTDKVGTSQQTRETVDEP